MTERVDRHRRNVSAIVHTVIARVDLDEGLHMGFEFFRGAALSRDRHVVVAGARACPVEPTFTSAYMLPPKNFTTSMHWP
eukprot:9412393-Pyramimonas_sp.AAC.1